MNGHNPGGNRRIHWPPDSIINCCFSDCGRYRYTLSEIWDQSKPLVMFLMMNPSIADESFADPTLIKTGKYARSWGYGGQVIGNIHAYRATDSKCLLKVNDPVGAQNDARLIQIADNVEMIILAYGLPPKPLRPRAESIVRMLLGRAPLKFLKLTKNGTPSHPLYLKSELIPSDFKIQDLP